MPVQESAHRADAIQAEMRDRPGSYNYRTASVRFQSFSTHGNLGGLLCDLVFHRHRECLPDWVYLVPVSGVRTGLPNILVHHYSKELACKCPHSPVIEAAKWAISDLSGL